MATGVSEASNHGILFENGVSSSTITGFKIVDRYQSSGCRERIDCC